MYGLGRPHAEERLAGDDGGADVERGAHRRAAPSRGPRRPASTTTSRSARHRWPGCSIRWADRFEPLHVLLRHGTGGSCRRRPRKALRPSKMRLGVVQHRGGRVERRTGRRARCAGRTSLSPPGSRHEHVVGEHVPERQVLVLGLVLLVRRLRDPDRLTHPVLSRPSPRAIKRAQTLAATECPTRRTPRTPQGGPKEPTTQMGFITLLRR